MKDFDIELAKKGHPVCTREGKPVRILTFDMKTEYYPIVAIIDMGGAECVATFTTKGLCGKMKCSNDLMLVTTKHEGWVNIYCGIYGHFLGREIWPSEEEALRHSQEGTRVATIKVEWEEDL